MWKEAWDGITALLSYSPMAIVLGVVIVAISASNAYLTKKSGSERTLSTIAACLSVLLIFIQSISGKLASREAEIKQQAALMQQRDDLTRSFNDGTLQVMTVTSEAARQTQQNAKDQTEAIERQAQRQFVQLQGVTNGAKNCPDIMFMDSWPWDTKLPIGFGVTNLDESANVYDFNAMVIEYGPPDVGTTYSSMLQQRPLSMPLIVAQHSMFEPFQFLTKTKTLSIQISGTTRANKQCGYQYQMVDEGNNKWVLNSDERSQDSKRTRTLIGKQAVAAWAAKLKKAKGAR